MLVLRFFNSKNQIRRNRCKNFTQNCPFHFYCLAVNCQKMVTATAKMVFLAVFLFFFENFLAKGTGERTEKQAVLLAKGQGISL
jgi:hypothetical protein